MYPTTPTYSEWRIDHRPERGLVRRPAGRAEIDLRVADLRRRGRVER